MVAWSSFFLPPALCCCLSAARKGAHCGGPPVGAVLYCRVGGVGHETRTAVRGPKPEMRATSQSIGGVALLDPSTPRASENMSAAIVLASVPNSRFRLARHVFSIFCVSKRRRVDTIGHFSGDCGRTPSNVQRSLTPRDVMRSTTFILSGFVWSPRLLIANEREIEYQVL